jgi:hypothetical protein
VVEARIVVRFVIAVTPVKLLLSVRSVDEAAVVGQVVRQMSPVRQRVVKVPLVEKRLVEVAWVEVEFLAVKFWRVVDEVTKRLVVVARVATRLSKVLMPVKALLLARRVEEAAVAAEPVIEPTMVFVTVRLVKTPLVAKSEVEVALVVVDSSPVKFWRVEEEVERRLAKVPRPEKVAVPPRRVVKVPLVANALVVVEFVEVDWRKVRF